MYVCMYVCMYACMCIYTCYVCVYIYIYTSPYIYSHEYRISPMRMINLYDLQYNITQNNILQSPIP